MTFGYPTFRDHELILEQQRFKWLRNVPAPGGGLAYKSWSAIKHNCLLDDVFGKFPEAIQDVRAFRSVDEDSSAFYTMQYPSKKFNKFTRHN